MNQKRMAATRKTIAVARADAGAAEAPWPCAFGATAGGFAAGLGGAAESLGGGDDDVGVFRLAREHLALRALEAFAHHLGVATDAGALLLVLDADELGAERLDLIGDFGPRIVPTHDRAEADRSADRRKAGDAGADDEYPGRRHLAGGGNLAGKETPEMMRGLDHRAIASDVRHRRKRIELLRARDAW